MMGHSILGLSLLLTGHLAQARAHYDHAMTLYDPQAHRPLAMRFGQDTGVAILSYRSLASWMLGYPDAALTDTSNMLKDAREIGQAATLSSRLTCSRDVLPVREFHDRKRAMADELFELADEKGALFWKPVGNASRGWLCTVAGQAE